MRAYISRTNWYLQISKRYLSYRFQFAPLSFLISVLSGIFGGENFDDDGGVVVQGLRFKFKLEKEPLDAPTGWPTVKCTLASRIRVT